MSTWKLAIQAMLGKFEVPRDLPTHLAAAGLRELPVTVEHTDAVRDVEGLTCLTTDAAVLEAALAHVRSAQD